MCYIRKTVDLKWLKVRTTGVCKAKADIPPQFALNTSVITSAITDQFY